MNIFGKRKDWILFVISWHLNHVHSTSIPCILFLFILFILQLRWKKNIWKLRWTAHNDNFLTKINIHSFLTVQFLFFLFYMWFLRSIFWKQAQLYVCWCSDHNKLLYHVQTIATELRLIDEDKKKRRINAQTHEHTIWNWIEFELNSENQRINIKRGNEQKKM